MTKSFPNLFKLLKSDHCQGYKNKNTNKRSDKYKKRCSAAWYTGVGSTTEQSGTEYKLEGVPLCASNQWSVRIIDSDKRKVGMTTAC